MIEGLRLLRKRGPLLGLWMRLRHVDIPRFRHRSKEVYGDRRGQLRERLCSACLQVMPTITSFNYFARIQIGGRIVIGRARDSRGSGVTDVSRREL